MTSNSSDAPRKSRLQLSADWWSVIAALALALGVKLGLIPKVPW